MQRSQKIIRRRMRLELENLLQRICGSRQTVGMIDSMQFSYYREAVPLYIPELELAKIFPRLLHL